jgi:hypothetical protein
MPHVTIGDDPIVHEWTHWRPNNVLGDPGVWETHCKQMFWTHAPQSPDRNGDLWSNDNPFHPGPATCFYCIVGMKRAYD